MRMAGRALGGQGRRVSSLWHLEARTPWASHGCSEPQYLHGQNEHSDSVGWWGSKGRRVCKWFVTCGAPRRLGIMVRVRFCDYLLQKEPQRRRDCWAGRWCDTGLTLLALGKKTSWLRPQAGVWGWKPHPFSALTSRDPNGEGLPLWPVYNKTEWYLQLDLNVSLGQSLKELEVELWTKPLHLTMSTSGALPSPLSSLVFLSLLLPSFFSFAPWEVTSLWFPFSFSFCNFSCNHYLHSEFSYFVESLAFADVLWTGDDS